LHKQKSLEGRKNKKIGKKAGGKRRGKKEGKKI